MTAGSFHKSELNLRASLIRSALTLGVILIFLAFVTPVQAYTAWFGETPPFGTNPTYRGSTTPYRADADAFSTTLWQQSMAGKWLYSANAGYSTTTYHSAARSLALGFSGANADGTDYGNVIEARDYLTTRLGTLVIWYDVTSYSHNKDINWDNLDAGIRVKLYDSSTPGTLLGTYTYWLAAWYHDQDTKTAPAGTKLIGSGKPTLNTWLSISQDPTSDFNINWANCARVRIELYVSAAGTWGDVFQIYMDDFTANLQTNAIVAGNDYGGSGSPAGLSVSTEVFSAVDYPGGFKSYALRLTGIANTRVDHAPYGQSLTSYWSPLYPSGYDTGITGDDQGVWIDLSPTFSLLTPFKYFGQFYKSLYICSNGWAAFSTYQAKSGFTPCEATPQPIPNPMTKDVLGPVAILAPLWRDLNRAAGGNIVYYCVLSQCTIEWHNVPSKSTGALNDFEIRFDTTGEIRFGYSTIAAKGSEEPNPTIGISDPTGTLGNAFTLAAVQSSMGVDVWDQGFHYLHALAFQLTKSSTDTQSYANWDTSSAQLAGYNVQFDHPNTRGSYVQTYIKAGTLAMDFLCVFTSYVTVGLGCLAVDYAAPILGDYLASVLSTTDNPTSACGSTDLNKVGNLGQTGPPGCLKVAVSNDGGYSYGWNVDAALADTLNWVVPMDGLPHVLRISFAAEIIDGVGGISTLTTDVVLGTTTQGQVLFLDNFEKNAWTAGSDPADMNWLYWETSGLWHATSYIYRSFDVTHTLHSEWYGQESTHNYYTGARNSGSLVSPLFTIISASDTLSFGSYWDTRTGTSLDQKLVQVSTDGMTWSTLTQISDSTDTINTWKSHSISLSSYAGKAVQIRFYFDTVDTGVTGHAGWFVDDVSIGVVQTVTASVTPSSQTVLFGPYCVPTAYFTASANGGTSPYTYYWNFGDGATGSGSSASHTYAYTPGTYTVRLTAFDAHGMAGIASASVTVTSRRVCQG